MTAIDSQRVDITNYVKEAQEYIMSAIKDPGSVPSRYLAEVASTIVNRAWEDPGYYSNAALICHHITKVEHEQQGDFSIPKYTFRTGLMDACRLLMNGWTEMREAKMEYWLSFCRFLADIYKLVRPEGQNLTMLSRIMLEILGHLASVQCINNFDEADLLCNLFHDCGRDLTEDDSRALDEVVDSIRDVFLDSRTDPTMQGLLLPLIELHASKFNLSKDAKSFYFQM